MAHRQSYDVIVVGVGSMGASACYQLAKHGVRVLGLEQFDIPHTRGAAGGYSRMIRLAYFEHPGYVALLQRAYELWHELECEANEKFLYLTGGLYMGNPDCELVSGSLRAAREYGLPHEIFEQAELAERYPQFTLPKQFVGFFEKKAGFLRPERAIAALADQAMRRGAQLHGHERVLDWTATDHAVQVKTNRATYEAGHVIFSGGAWSNQLAGELGIPLTVTRQVMGWFWPSQADQFALGRFPVWAIDPGHDERFEGLYYGFPMMVDNPGFKIAHHYPGPATDAHKVERQYIAGDEDQLVPPLRQYVPAAEGPLLAIRVCLYTNTPDGHFIIDQHPHHPNVTVACGFSGHGFKFASVVGELLANLATNGRTDLAIDFVSLSRQMPT